MRPHNTSKPDLSQAGVAPGPTDSYLQLQSGTHSQFQLTTRYEFSIGEEDTPGAYHWRGIRGIRTLVTNSSNLSHARWALANAWALDMEYGQHEHLRRMIYQVTSTLYAGVYFGFLDVLEWPRDESAQLPQGDVNRIYVGTSRDGINFDLRWIYAAQPLHEPEPLDWDRGVTTPAAEFVTAHGYHWLYYRGCSKTHDRCGDCMRNKWLHNTSCHGCHVGLLKFRQDGMLHLSTSSAAAWGTVTTRWFILRGRQIEVNVEFWGAKGTLEARIASNTSGVIMSKQHMTGGLHVILEWEGATNVAQFFNHLVMLKFRLKAANLYAFQVRSL